MRPRMPQPLLHAKKEPLQSSWKIFILRFLAHEEKVEKEIETETETETEKEAESQTHISRKKAKAFLRLPR